jgi:hypothetical protein
MAPLAHHAAEQALAPLLLLLAGGGLGLLATIGRAQLAAILVRLTGRDGTRRRG